MLMAKQWVFLRIGRTNLCGKHKYTIQLYPFLQKEQMLEDGFTFPIRIRNKKHYQHKYEKMIVITVIPQRTNTGGIVPMMCRAPFPNGVQSGQNYSLSLFLLPIA